MTERPDTPLAKLMWKTPETGELQQHVLAEGATVTIGRQAGSDICIPERHVSRQHAVIRYQDGVFLIADLGSANGTFVNDVQINQAWPLVNGDVIRLYVPELRFSAVVTEQERNAARTTGRLSTRSSNTGQGQLIITNGPMEGNTIRLLAKLITVGRATANADWDISLADPSVSRPHARLEYVNQNWVIYDLGSSNGTLVNDVAVTEKGRVLRDGDVLLLGKTKALFRSA